MLTIIQAGVVAQWLAIAAFNQRDPNFDHTWPQSIDPDLPQWPSNLSPLDQILKVKEILVALSWQKTHDVTPPPPRGIFAQVPPPNVFKRAFNGAQFNVHRSGSQSF